MGGIFSASTFVSLRATEWAAVGAVVGGLATLGLLVFAARQLRGTIALGRTNQELQRELLLAQTRPYVVANLEFRSIIAILAVSNIGNTSAFDVQVTLDTPFESSLGRDDDWQESALFTDGLPMMAPTYKVRFLLDSLPRRKETDLPPVIAGSISYHDADGRSFSGERFVIDVQAVGLALQPDKTIHDLVERVDKIGKTMDKWNQGNGIRVSNLNLDRHIARENRPMLVSKSLEACKSEGWRAGLRVWTNEWQRRFGWHRW